MIDLELRNTFGDEDWFVLIRRTNARRSATVSTGVFQYQSFYKTVASSAICHEVIKKE
jgi:hypothetical protein